MRIAFLLHDAYRPSDTVRMVTGLASGLVARHEVELVSAHRTADRMPFAVPARVETRALVDLRAASRRRSDPPPSELSELRLSAYLRSSDADVVIATTPYLACLLAGHGREAYLRIGQEPEMRRLHTAALLASLDPAISRLDAYVTFTEADADAYRAALGAASAHITCVPACRPETGIEPSTGDAKIVLSAGPLTRGQRHDRLLDAFAKVVAVHPDWSLRIHGSGEDEDRLRRRINDLGLYNYVLLIGTSAPMAAEWAKGSLAVLPGDVEPSGMAVVEAMSCGLPVIGTSGEHAPSEIITHGRDGLLIGDGPPPVDGLADAICRLIENPAERRRMAVQARRTAGRHRPEHIAALYEALLADLGRRRPTAGGRRVNGMVHRRTRRLMKGLRSVLSARRPIVGCRAAPDGSLVFQIGADQLGSGTCRLVLRSRGSGPGPWVSVVPLHRQDADGPATAVLDPRLHRLTDGYWDVLVLRGRGTARPAAAGLVETAHLLDPAVRQAAHDTGQWWIPYTARDGALAVRAWFRREHAEVRTVEVGDQAIRLRGRVYGRAALAHGYRCAARIRGQGGYLIEIPCEPDPGGGFLTTLPLSMIAESHPGGRAEWELRLTAYPGPELRLGMLTGDLADRRDITRFPAVSSVGQGGPVVVGVHLNRDHDLVLTTVDAALDRL